MRPGEVVVHFTHYNFCRPHQTLSKEKGMPTSPAMAEGIERYPWSLHQLVAVLEEWERATA